MRALPTILLLSASASAFGYPPKVDAAFKGRILFSAAPLKAKGTDKEQIAQLKAANLKTLPCHKDTSGTTMTTFHVTAFPSPPVTGSVSLKFNDALRTLTADGKAVVESGVQLTTGDAQGPKLKVVLLGGAKTLAEATVDAPCLKPSAGPAKK